MSKVNHRQSSIRALQAGDESSRPVRDQRFSKGSKPVKTLSKAVPAVVATDVLPKRGDSLAVLHRSNEDHVHMVRVVRDGKEVRQIAQVYLSDDEGYRVKDTAGDVWSIKRSTQGDTVWQTVA